MSHGSLHSLISAVVVGLVILFRQTILIGNSGTPVESKIWGAAFESLFVEPLLEGSEQSTGRSRQVGEVAVLKRHSEILIVLKGLLWMTLELLNTKKSVLASFRAVYFLST